MRPLHLCESSRSNLTKLTYPDGYYVGREYDEMNRLSAIKLNGSTTPAAEFSYDALSRRTGLSLSNGAEVSYDYQADNRLTSLTQDFNGTDTVTFDYGYDAIGRLTSQDISDATYSWKPSASSTRTYGTANEVNQFPTVGGQSYGYSDNGMLTSDGVWTYSYDSTNRMESASKSGLSLSFENDPMNRLASFSDGSSTTKQVFSGGALIASYDGSNNLQSRTVFGASAAEPLLSVASGGAITTMHQDGLGSVIASTDSGGTVSNSKGFGSFGESSVSSGLSFGFAATPVVTGSALIGNSLNPSDGVGVGAAANPMGYNEAMQQLHSGLWWLMAAKGTGSDDDYGYSPPSEPNDPTKWGNGGTGGGNNSGHSYGGNSPGQLAPGWGTPDSSSPRNWGGAGSPFSNYIGLPMPDVGSDIEYLKASLGYTNRPGPEYKGWRPEDGLDWWNPLDLVNKIADNDIRGYARALLKANGIQGTANQVDALTHAIAGVASNGVNLGNPRVSAFYGAAFEILGYAVGSIFGNAGISAADAYSVYAGSLIGQYNKGSSAVNALVTFAVNYGDTIYNSMAGFSNNFSDVPKVPLLNVPISQ